MSDLLIITPSVTHPKDGYGALICPSHQIGGLHTGSSKMRQAERARKRKLKEPGIDERDQLGQKDS